MQTQRRVPRRAEAVVRNSLFPDNSPSPSILVPQQLPLRVILSFFPPFQGHSRRLRTRINEAAGRRVARAVPRGRIRTKGVVLPTGLKVQPRSDHPSPFAHPARGTIVIANSGVWPRFVPAGAGKFTRGAPSKIPADFRSPSSPRHR